MVDGTAGAAAAQEQQEQQQQHQRTTAPAAAAAAAAASVLHCYGVSLSGTHVFVAASRQPVLYPPTPADARGSALGNNTFDSCFGLQN